MNIISNNKKARHEYNFINTYEAGIELLGAEVKSLRFGKCNLKGSYCKFFKDELFLVDCHISKYENINSFERDIEEKRIRKLLLHRRELNKIKKELDLNQGYAIPAIKIYFNKDNRVKIEIALASGKKLHDKRASEKEKDIKRKLQRKDYE